MIIHDLPDAGQHNTRTVQIGPDDMMYISVGSTCNECAKPNPENATILRATLDGKTRSIFASGLRDTVGWGWHPKTGELWGMDKYVGHFGAYGQNPVIGENGGGAGAGEGVGAWPADFKRGEMKPKFFRSPLHNVKLSNDGLPYICDRGNNRIQIFKAAEVGKVCANPNGDAGKCGFVGEIHIAPQTSSGTSGTVNFSTDAKQSCLYVADLTNDTIYVINRQNLQEMSRFATGGRQAGEFHWPHVVSVDSEGNVYSGEVDGAARVQKFIRYGPAGCSGAGNPEVGKYLNQ